MGCCGGARPRSIKRQNVPQERAQKQSANGSGTRTKTIVRVAPAKRQYAVPRQKCPKCGYPTMVVHITGRERHRCSNVNCRTVLP